MSFAPPLALAEAWDRLLRDVTALPAEECPIDQALGRTLAAPLFAKRTQPSADLSAMDGYAVPEGETVGPWTIVGESAAGHPFAGALGTGQATRISTGAMIPEGAGAVVLQENTRRDGNLLFLNGEGAPTPRHIRRKGFDFAAGQEILPAGTRVAAPQIALAVSAGIARLPLTRLPNIAIIDSGDELAQSIELCGEHQIPASNGAMIAAMAAPFIANCRRIGPVRDTMEALAEAFAAASTADVIVTSGGASVGDHDLMRPALTAYGADLNFWRVAIKPGKPLMLARKGSQWIVGLPGNPVSSFVTAYLFLLPLLRKLGGNTSPLPQGIESVLQGRLPKTGDRHEFVRAVATFGKVVPVEEQDSSALASLGRSNALISRPPGSPEAATGERVSIYSLG